MRHVLSGTAMAFTVLSFFLAVNAEADMSDIRDQYNCYEPIPVGLGSNSLTSFTFIFKGDVVSQIDTTATAGDAGVNAYAQINQHLFGGHATTSVTATLVGGNTEVTFTGPPIVPSMLSSYGFPVNGLPHFGVDEISSSTQSLIPMGSFWTDSSNNTTLLPILTVNPVPVLTSAKNIKYRTFFFDLTDPGGNTVGQWFEVPYIGAPPAFQLANDTGANVTLSKAGFMTSDTEIPLDDLNFGTTSPPGFPGSTFEDLPKLDGKMIPGGGTLNPAPEPSFWVVLGVGLTSLLVISRRRRSPTLPDRRS